MDATAANGVISFTGKGPEGGTNYSFSVSSTYNTQLFGHSSFNGTSGTLANGVSSQTAFYGFTIPSAGGFAPNGNILAANDTVNGNWVYTYDSFNRLSSAVAAARGLGCGWVYDRYGNRWQQNPYTGACGSDQRTYTMNGAGTNNNRMDGASYDALGNLLVNPVPGGASYSYDAESRLIQVLNAGVTTKYLYDAEGRRVAKLSGTTVTNEYLFDTEGNQQIELNGSGAVLHTNLYAGGKLIATYQGTNTYFHFTDWLGTRRYEANSAGAQTETCTNLPFGDSQSCTGTPDATEHHFTGKEHDTESGLDYFGARYYANVLGRWISPDWAGSPGSVPYATFSDPQTVNLYNYLRASPINQIDIDGHGDAMTRYNQCMSDSACAQTVQKQSFSSELKVEGGLLMVGAGVTGMGEVAGGSYGLYVTVTGSIGASGLIVGGTTQVAGGLTNTDTEQSVQAVNALTSPAGVAATIVTKDLAVGDAAATLSNAASILKNPAEAVKSNPADVASTAASTPGAVQTVWQTLTNFFTTPPPPPAPAPPPSPPTQNPAPPAQNKDAGTQTGIGAENRP